MKCFIVILFSFLANTGKAQTLYPDAILYKQDTTYYFKYTTLIDSIKVKLLESAIVDYAKSGQYNYDLYINCRDQNIALTKHLNSIVNIKSYRRNYKQFKKR